MNRIEKECTTVFLDIRNFTNNLQKNYQKEGFFFLMEKVYSKGIELGKILSFGNNFYINSTGDGFLCIFFDKFHFLQGYFLSLLLHYTLTSDFIDFYGNKVKEGNYWFGVGIESGKVKQISVNISGRKIETYLGNVINKAARLEALTKDHARAPIIYGPEINEYLVKYYCNVSYKNLMKKAKSNISSENAKKIHEQMSAINSKLLSSYLFEHRIKGVQNATPVFRISPTLLNISKNNFWNLITTLPDDFKKGLKIILSKYGYVWKLVEK